MTVWNLGSVNADRFYAVPHIPAAGETLAATGYAEGLGGKGANMAVASARAGSRVELIGAVGADGGWMRDRLAGYGVSVGHVAQVEGPSGHANIAVDGDGENQILILPGANVLLDRGQVAAALAAAAAGDIFVCQNETNLQREAADIARAQGLRVAYAAAPFSAGAVGHMLPVTDLLVMNAVEASQLEEATGTAPADLPVRDVVITLGPDGCRWIDTVSGQSRDFPSPRVSAVDTTGAGDTFTGYLLAGLDQEAGMPEALHLALRAAALKVTRRGTADAIPARDEVTGWQP
jgi:ribokinase